MHELPPLLTPDFELDAVSVTLEKPPRLLDLPHVRVPIAAVPVLLVGVAIASGAWCTAAALFALGVATNAAVSAWRSRHTPELVLTVRRGRLQVGDRKFPREFHTGDVAEARWDCTPPTTHLVLVYADGREEEVAHVRRQSSERQPGITRRQREWLVQVITDQLDPATAESVPEGLRHLTRGRERA
ncbi:MAG: hypothetical protein H6737_05370 [Alphaproteobacteria bacterium]|nr:hypothetical protein [Alphaproteobacteria bacterium]